MKEVASPLNKGPNLYDDPATRFVCVAVTVEPGEAAEALARVKGFLRRPQGEVKFSSLARSDEGVAALTRLLGEPGHRVEAWYANKKFATAGTFFEYVLQPVLADHDALFYRNDFHRFVANLLYGALEATDRRAHELLADL